MNIDNLNEKELLALSQQVEERKRIIENEKLLARKAVVEEKIETLRKNKDFLLSMLDHDRTSCSDTHVSNGWVGTKSRCKKCHLIQILNHEFTDGDFDVDFEIHINIVE